MLDDEKGDFVGTAVCEVKEETGIKLNLHDMVDLTALLDPSTGTRLFPLARMCIAAGAARGLALIPPCEPVWRDDTKLVHGNIKRTNILPDWFSETPARRVQEFMLVQPGTSLLVASLTGYQYHGLEGAARGLALGHRLFLSFLPKN